MENQIQNKNVSNTLIYAGLGVQALGLFPALIGIANIVMLICIIIDANKLKATNVVNKPSAWWCLLPPVYFYKRQTALNQSMVPFFVNLGMAILQMIIYVLVFFVVVAATMGDN